VIVLGAAAEPAVGDVKAAQTTSDRTSPSFDARRVIRAGPYTEIRMGAGGAPPGPGVLARVDRSVRWHSGRSEQIRAFDQGRGVQSRLAVVILGL
jgi:hypothetical protein